MQKNNRSGRQGRNGGDNRFRSQRPHGGAPRSGHGAGQQESAAGWENLVAGRNAVLEALKSQQPDTLYLAPGQTGSIGKIAAAAKEAGCPVKEVSMERLDMMAPGLNHQGVVLTLVWFGLTWSLELYQQTVARLWRQGQTSETVVVQHIVTKGTIDNRIMKALSQKEHTQTALIDAVKADLKI